MTRFTRERDAQRIDELERIQRNVAIALDNHQFEIPKQAFDDIANALWP